MRQQYQVFQVEVVWRGNERRGPARFAALYVCVASHFLEALSAVQGKVENAFGAGKVERLEVLECLPGDSELGIGIAPGQARPL